MKRMMALVAVAAAAACAPAPAPVALTAEAQARLDAEIAGRVPGTPQACVRLQDLRAHRSVAPGVVVWDGPGDTIYVNRAPGCPELRPHWALRTRTVGTQLCEGEFAIIFDPTTGIEYGSCPVGRFQPYHRR